ncbi:MAG: flagellar basal body-associated FliL family protein [Lachnospiraceae bacterium]|nr:flagellar basal body-associated FliL family protein [Lachnospiraceae bacterium]
MKKNMISIIILALLIVNIVLTAIMMFSVTSASRKTAALVDNIAAALDLELAANGEEEEEEQVSMEDTETYPISEPMTILLKSDEGADGESKDHYFIVSVTLSINTKDKGYKTYGSDLSAQENLIKSEISDTCAQYTLEEVKNNQDQIRDEILERLQTMFDSKFIYNVSFSDTMFQ